MRSGGVSVLMARTLADAVERAGVARRELLTAAALDPEKLQHVDSRLSLLEYDRLTRAALQLSGDPALGLRLGEHSPTAAFDILGHLAEHSASLRESFEVAVRYSRILADGPECSLIEHGDVASLRYALPPVDWPTVRVAAELAVAGALRMIRRCVRERVVPRGVSFGYKAPPHSAEYEQHFGVRVHFSRPYTGIDFDRAWLDCVPPHANPRLYAVLEAQALLALERLDEGAELSGRVQAYLASFNPRSLPSMEAVSRHFGMSTRSLRRRLTSEGSDYRTLLEGARASIACTLLRQPHRTIQEVADTMGFATAAAFHRAFRRWMGTTPRRFRARR